MEKRKWVYVNIVKRAIDIVVSFVVCFALIPVAVVVGAAIKLDDRGPVFYLAKRIGKNCKPFKMLKFRSMICNAPDIRNEDGSCYSAEDDPRLTRVGRFLRRSSVDELPQFANVLLGHMSIIGPRPDLEKEVYPDYEIERNTIKPGITGYAQAYFRNSLPIEKRYEMDLYYVRNISMLLDIKIVFQTILCVLSARNVYRNSENIEAPEQDTESGGAENVKEEEILV